MISRTITRLSFHLMGILVATAQYVSAQVTVEIVNDSGLADSNVFVKVPGYYITNGVVMLPTTVPTNLFVDLAEASPPNPVMLPLTTLTTNGSAAPYSIVSPISGRTDTVYSIQVDYVNSGAIYFTYYQPYTFTNGTAPSPPPDSAGNAYRYDYAECTINNSNAPNNSMDVTYVDKFGIPLQLEWFTGGNLKSGSYVYASTRTLVNDFSTNGLENAVFSVNATNISPGWQYTGPDSYTNFARILSPEKTSGTTYSVSPYPKINYYLNSLVGSPNAFWMNGYAPHGGYYAVGYYVSLSTNASGWLATLAYTTNVPPFDPTLITGLPYTNTITFPILRTNASQYVYGSPVGPNYYSTNGVLVTDATGGTYPLETWMIGDVLSALNFGFWGGRYGTNSADWFSTVEWSSFPFGSARQIADGYYNPYAALIYNNADPYSFAFSERITPDVLVAPTNGDTVRITILPDDRLDSPVVSVLPNLITYNSITLRWKPVTGATGYRVNVLRPLNIPSVDLAASAINYKYYMLSGLKSGTPYVMSVQAKGTAHGNPIITPARPVSATTMGTFTPTKGSFAQILVSFSAADPFYQLGSVIINGTKLTRSDWSSGSVITYSVSEGTNQLPVTILNQSGQVIFNDWLQFVLAPPFSFTNSGTNGSGEYHTFSSTNSAISSIILFGQKLGQPAPQAVGGWPPAGSGDVGPIDGYGVMYVTNYIGSATNFIINPANSSLKIGLSYVPAETRIYSPITIPSARFVDTSSTNGEFHFDYNVPAGADYNILATTNLVGSWENIFSGTGRTNTESYTEPATNGCGRRFYRIQY
jgi:hypothetical protein